MSTIKGLVFGDKGAIARTLSTKGAELKASIIETAVLPIVSNALQGHSTFKPLISGKGHNEKCPLQSALWALTHTKAGKPANTPTARAIVGAFALATGKAADQSSHDDVISEAVLLISEALTPTPREAKERADYKALSEALQARVDALAIDLADKVEKLNEARATIAELMAAASAPTAETLTT